MTNEVLMTLEKLEQFRVRIEKGETTGSLDWAVRMCQAIVAGDHYADRSEWMYWLKKEWSGGKYVEGEVIDWCGKRLRVERIYQLTNKEMSEHELVHRNRVTLRNVDDPAEVHDFAIHEG